MHAFYLRGKCAAFGALLDFTEDPPIINQISSHADPPSSISNDDNLALILMLAVAGFYHNK